jgi:hypothetical protein
MTNRTDQPNIPGAIMGRRGIVRPEAPGRRIR